MKESILWLPRAKSWGTLWGNHGWRIVVLLDLFVRDFLQETEPEKQPLSFNCFCDMSIQMSQVSSPVHSFRKKKTNPRIDSQKRICSFSNCTPPPPPAPYFLPPSPDTKRETKDGDQQQWGHSCFHLYWVMSFFYEYRPFLYFTAVPWSQSQSASFFQDRRLLLCIFRCVGRSVGLSVGPSVPRLSKQGFLVFFCFRWIYWML